MAARTNGAIAAVAAIDNWRADAVVIEVNQGGDMATETLKTVRRDLPIQAVHAARGKALRAQPVAACTNSTRTPRRKVSALGPDGKLGRR